MHKQNYWLPEQPANDNARHSSEMRELVITLAVCGFMIVGFLVSIKPVAVYGADLIMWMERL